MHQMETVSIQMVPLHVTVPLAMSWILVGRTAQVSASTSIPVDSIHWYIQCLILTVLNISHMLDEVSTLW